MVDIDALSADHDVSASTVRRAVALLKTCGHVVAGRHGGPSVFASTDRDDSDDGSTSGIERDTGRPTPAAEGTVEVTLLHDGALVKKFCTAVDYRDGAKMQKILAAAAKRHANGTTDLCDYELEIREPGGGELLQTFVAV